MLKWDLYRRTKMIIKPFENEYDKEIYDCIKEDKEYRNIEKVRYIWISKVKERFSLKNQNRMNAIIVEARLKLPPIIVIVRRTVFWLWSIYFLLWCFIYWVYYLFLFRMMTNEEDERRYMKMIYEKTDGMNALYN